MYGRANTALETAVASFFTPLSKKPPEKTIWQERAPHDDTHSTLLVGRYELENKCERLVSSQISQRKPKIAAFDFVSYRSKQPTKLVLIIAWKDSTLIQTNSGKKHATEAEDWKWWHLSVPAILRKLYIDDG